MPSSQTPNYNLNQWSRDDRVLMEDFNADNAKIDAALGEKADKSAVAELNAQVGQVELSMPRVVFGTYTGDGAASKHIELGFPPKALLLFCQNGRTSYCVSYGMAYGGLALEGHSSSPTLALAELSGGRVLPLLDPSASPVGEAFLFLSPPSWGESSFSSSFSREESAPESSES